VAISLFQNKKTKQIFIGLAMLSPALLILLLFTVIPTIEGVLLAFFKANARVRRFVGLNNFIYLIKDDIFWKAMKNTLCYVGFCVPLMVLIPFYIAVVASKMKKSWQGYIRFAFYVPLISAGMITSMVWDWIFNARHGLLNYLIGLIGIEPVIWLGTIPAAFFAVCIVLITSSMGMNLILYMSALSAIDKNIFEAAGIDGCSEAQKTYYILFPLMLPIIAFVTIMQTIGVALIWEIIFVLTSGGPYYATTSLVFQIFIRAFQSGKYGLAAAESIIVLTIIMCLALLQKRVLIDRE